jgi:glycosyltransferase involved in cell wall biosynthesis
MLKVTIDATPISPKPSGVGLYIYNLINSLHELQQQQNNFKLGISYQPSWRNWLSNNFTPPENISSYSNLHVLPIPVRISSKLGLIPGSPLFNFEKKLGMPDIMHGTNYSVFPCRGTVNLMNLYDLSFMKYPEYVNSVVEKYTNQIKQCLKWTNAVLTISESSKRDIVEYLQIPPERIFITPLASRYHVNYLTDELISKIDKDIDYNFSQPYLLFVSTIEPRKNITAMISAFNLLKSKHKIPHALVLIGQKGWKYEPIFQEIERSPWKESIHHLDYLSDELVALFYSRADVFVYPSHYEGFGLPVLEAMTLGAPVVTSNTSSLPEVAGDAALLVNPSDVEEQANAILQIISDSQFRNELITKGKARATLFSWERAARETLHVYESIRGMKTSGNGLDRLRLNP